MTKEEINFAIVENVFGLKHWQDKIGNTYFGDGFDMHSSSIDNYSASISAAWDVVEKMREDGWCFSLSDFKPSLASFEASFVSFGTIDKDHQHTSDTAPMAICLAALKAKK